MVGRVIMGLCQINAYSAKKRMNCLTSWVADEWISNYSVSANTTDTLKSGITSKIRKIHNDV